MNTIKRTEKTPFTFEDLFKTDWLGGTADVRKIGVNTPAANILEGEQSFTIELAVPGFVKENINIELDNDRLTISSKENPTIDVKKKYTRKEFGYKSFKRIFDLPETINIKEIKASYEQGILKIELPKKEEAKVQPKRSITIG